MKASWQEDYFKALISLGLLLPVNPKTDTQKNAIGAILWLDENLARLLLMEPRCLGKEECTDEVIEKSTDFRCWQMLSKKGLRSRANSDSCLGGGRRVGDDGAAGPGSGAAFLRV